MATTSNPFDLRNIEWPKFELPQFEMPKFELPDFELPKWDAAQVRPPEARGRGAAHPRPGDRLRP